MPKRLVDNPQIYYKTGKTNVNSKLDTLRNMRNYMHIFVIYTMKSIRENIYFYKILL